MLPISLLKDKFWLFLAIALLVVEWSMPMVAQGLYAESHFYFSVAFSAGWTGLITALGLAFYVTARKNAQLASLAIVLSLATLTLMYRTSVSFVQPQFTAEDGCVFFLQQRESGLSAFLIPHNGYYHTVVRILAALVAPVPTLFVPAFYNLAWLGIYSLIVAYILIQYPDRKWAPIVALVTAFVAHTCEIFLVVTDTIWLGGLALTTFVLFPVPDLKRWARYLVTGVLLIFSMSGPFSLALSPFFLLRWSMNRKTFPLIYVVAVILGALVQMSALHSYYVDKNAGPSLTLTSLLLCLKIAVIRVPWSLAVGYQPVDFYWLIGLALTLILFVFIAREIKSNPGKHIFTIGCLLLCAVFVVLNFIRISPPDVLVPLVNGDRYFYIPKVLFVWALIHLAATARTPKPFYLALFFCAMGSMAEFTTSQVVVDNHWPRYAMLIDQGGPVNVPLNPPGWSISIQGASQTLPK